MFMCMVMWMCMYLYAHICYVYGHIYMNICVYMCMGIFDMEIVSFREEASEVSLPRAKIRDFMTWSR